MSNSYSSTGRIVSISDTQKFGDKGFEKREFVLETEPGKYPQLIAFELHSDHCSKLDGCRIGDEVEVTFNLRGRKWTSPTGDTKYFNTLAVWKLRKLGEAAPEPAAIGDGNGDDLPF